MLIMLLAMTDSPEDKRKIELLYEEYNKIMYTYAYNMVKNHHDAEDIELQSWEKIIKNIEKFKDIYSNDTKNLILIVVERATIDFCRKVNRIKKTEKLYEQYESKPFMAKTDEHIEVVEILEALKKIPKKYRDILILHYVNDLSIKDISELLDMNEGTVAQRLYRGRLRLKEMKFYGIHRR